MDVPEYLHHRVGEVISIELDTSVRKNKWAIILGLIPYLDGNKWCVLWGKNIQEGVVGFGDTPSDAIDSFELAFYGMERITRESSADLAASV